MGPSGGNELSLHKMEDQHSPRSTDSGPMASPNDVHVDSMDSVSQQFNFTDDEPSRHHYKQNNNNHSPRAARYRSENSGNNKAKLAKIITVPGDPMPKLDQYTRKRTTNNVENSASREVTPRGTSANSVHRTVHALQSSQGKNGVVRGSTSYSVHETLRGVPTKSGGTQRGRAHPANKTGGSMRGFTNSVSHTTRTRNRIPSDHGSVAFRRHRPERKEFCVTQFEIEMDKHERHRFLPGEEVTGKIIFDIKSDIEIRFLELLIVGQTTATFVHTETGVGKTKRDLFLCKRSYIMGSPDSRYNAVINPGRYVSNFKCQLPDNVPSSQHYEDKLNGFSMDIAYLVKIRICDDVGASSARSTHSLNNLLKSIMSRRQMFIVRRPFDIHSVPMGLNPVTHTEEITLSCSIFSMSEPAIIELILDRSCFLVGDEIQVRLETQNRYARRIKKISCVLQQNIAVAGLRSRASFNIASVDEKYPKGTAAKRNKLNLTCYDIILPTLTTFIPSILSGCRLVKIQYSLIVNIKFTSCWGQLAMEVPISIGPCTDPTNLEKRGSVPFFNRPLRFPYFSPHAGNVGNGNAHSVQDDSKNQVKVLSNYSYTSCTSSFCCCFGGDALI